MTVDSWEFGRLVTANKQHPVRYYYDVRFPTSERSRPSDTSPYFVRTGSHGIRLIVWNCAQALDRKFEQLLSLEADIWMQASRKT